MRKSFVFLMILLLAAGVLVIFLARGNTPEEKAFSYSSYEPMNDYLARFNELFTEEPIFELLPVSAMPEKDLSWLLKDEADMKLIASRGLMFANGDILIVYFYESDKSIFYAVINGFMKSPIGEGKTAQFFIKNGFGFIISSPDYTDILEEMAEKAYMDSVKK